MVRQQFEAIIIGGSAGSMPVITALLNRLSPQFATPIVLVIHRLRNVKSEMYRILQEDQLKRNIIEPDDKQIIEQNRIYLAPQNYHLLIEDNRTFSLDYSEAVNFTRPSIDVSFESAAKVFGPGLLAILLSGSNKDGASGLAAVVSSGGMALVQSPESAAYKVMPQAAIDINDRLPILTPGDITDFLLSLEP